MATVEAAAAVAELAIHAGAGTGWIALAAGEVGCFVRAGLDCEDGGQAPAAGDQVGDAGHGAAEQACRDQRAGRREPWCSSAGAVCHRRSRSPRGDSGSTWTARRRLRRRSRPLLQLNRRALVIGEGLCPREAGVILEPVLQAMAGFQLQRMVALVGACSACVDASPVREQARADGRIKCRDRGRVRKRILVRSPNQLMRLGADIGDAGRVAEPKSCSTPSDHCSV